jgi:hypothetical protein
MALTPRLGEDAPSPTYGQPADWTSCSDEELEAWHRYWLAGRATLHERYETVMIERRKRERRRG